jgi:probable nitrogen fixation protein
MDTENIKHPIVQGLLQLIRAEDRSGAYDMETDADLIAPFIVTKAQKRDLPMFDDPDPDILMRVGQFYAAVAWEVERRTGKPVAPLMNIHHEGWGKALLICGRLVAVNSHVRELHRFGFEDLATLIDKAGKLADEGVASIEKFPEVADV